MNGSREALHIIPSFPKSYIDEFIDQGINPPGGDPVMGSFYNATVSLLQTNNPFNTFLGSIITERDMNPHAFSNLLFRTVQYLELFDENNPHYHKAFQDSRENTQKWEKELQRLLKAHPEKWTDMLLHKNTTTTIYPRYAGAQIVLNAFFPGKPLSVADFGCGGNYGLPGIAKGIPFDPIRDTTSSSLASMLLAPQPNLSEGLAIDRQNPRDPETMKWRLACSFYPQELERMPELIGFEEKIKDAPFVEFLQADLLTLHSNHANGTLRLGHFDAIIINTMLYQMDDKQRERVIALARKSLNENGILIIQDFASKDPENPQRLNFDVSWFGEPFGYRTFITSRQTEWDMKEVLQWNNGRCKQVREGDDFNLLMPRP